MAIPGDDRDVIFGDESPMALLRNLQQRFPEIPPDIVSSSLKKNNGNMSRCVDELEHLSSAYMYGRVGPRDPLYAGSSVPNASPGTLRSSAGFSSHLYSPERGVHPPKRDFHPQEYPPVEPPRDPDGMTQRQYTSWASLDTGVPDLEQQPHARRERTPPLVADEQRHVSLCTVDMHKKPSRTESAPAGPDHVVSGAGDMPTVSHPQKDFMQRPGSGLYNPTTSNGLERGLDPSELPFEPRPAWQEESYLLTDAKPANERGANSQWTFGPCHLTPAEVQSPSLIATSYQLDLPKPSSPASTPQKASQGTAVTYVKSTDRICLKPNSPAAAVAAAAAAAGAAAVAEPAGKPPAGAAVMDGEEKTEQWPVAKQDMNADSLRLPPTHLPERSKSKEKEDQAYTEALQMHQKARYERLNKELEAEKMLLARMHKETSRMEEDITLKRHHRGPFPTPGEITKLREQIRQLQIDNECMSREIESHKSQGLMDPTQSSNFYGNIEWTGAPGPVPPIPQHGNAISEPAVETLPPPPSYEVVTEDNQWSCPSCTFLNHPALDKCECCESPRI